MLIDRKNNFHRQTFFYNQIVIIRYHCIEPHCIIIKRNMSHLNVPPRLKKNNNTLLKSAFSFDESLYIFGLSRYIRWSTLILLFKSCSSSIAIVKRINIMTIPYQRSKNHNRTRRIAYLVYKPKYLEMFYDQLRFVNRGVPSS